MTFGERLTELRKENGYNTRNEFADKLGIPSTTLRNYETDAREPGHTFLKQISEMFNVSVDYLLCLTDEKEVLKSFRLKSSEYDHIKKYRALDVHGKDMVDTVLEKEHSRCAETRLIQMPIIEKQPDTTIQRLRLQYYASVSAGPGEFLLDDTYSLIASIPLNNESRKADFLVAVDGDSMEPQYYNDDILMIQQKENINIGEIGIFIMDEHAYLKQLGDGCLISLNQSYDPIPISPDGVKCIGRVIGKVSEEDFEVEEDNPAFSGNPLEDPEYLKMVAAYQEEYPGMAAEKGMEQGSREFFDNLRDIVEKDIERRKKDK